MLARGEVAVGELIENLRIYQAELEIQNEELRQSQNENAALLTRFTEFFTTLPVAEVVVDRLGLIIESNPEAQHLFGLRDPRYRPQFFARLVEESDRDRVILAWSGLGAARSIALPELVFRTIKGDGFIGDLHIARLPAGSGEEERFICAVLDRTEAVRQREALRHGQRSPECQRGALPDTRRPQPGLGVLAGSRWRLHLCLPRLRGHQWPPGGGFHGRSVPDGSADPPG